MFAFHFFQHRLLRNEAQSTTKSNTTSDHNILTKKTNKQTMKIVKQALRLTLMEERL